MKQNYQTTLVSACTLSYIRLPLNDLRSLLNTNNTKVFSLSYRLLKEMPIDDVYIPTKAATESLRLPLMLSQADSNHH